jgi:nitrate/TMAO reductase-like tetraheme cytochrome c subunit
MLTALRNICSTIANYDEHRLGREESMEPRKVQLSDQFCRGCHQPHTLDENKRCEFCRRTMVKAMTRPGPHLLTRFRMRLAAVIAPKQETYSLFK